MDLIHRNPHPLFLGISKASSGDQRKCDRPKTHFRCQCKALPVTGSEQLLFPMAAVYKQRTHSVDDIFCRKTKSGCQKDLSLFCRSDMFLTIRKQFVITGRLIDCAVASRTDRRMLICRVDDSIRFHLRYIIAYDFKWHCFLSFRRFLL